jgi:Lrp/AsnC family transcriptional regulator for asnA, asnC and gidA
MDEVDLQILKELAKNVRAPLSRIAEKTGVAPKTAQRRYEKMKEEGIILLSTVTLDLSKIGYQCKAYLMIANAQNHDKRETTAALKQIPNIFLITETLGDFDVFAIAVIKDFESMINLVTSIRSMPSVDEVEVALTRDTSFPVGKDFDVLLRI